MSHEFPNWATHLSGRSHITILRFAKASWPNGSTIEILASWHLKVAFFFDENDTMYTVHPREINMEPKRLVVCDFQVPC